MSGSDASSGEMPGFPFPGRSGPEPDEPLLDTILNGRPLPAHAPQGMLALADRLASLGRPAGPGEVPGEAAAMAAFRSSVAGASVSPAGGEPAHRKPARRPPPRRRAARPARLAGGLFVVMVGLGSAAAYADVLPGPVQDFAHHVIDAPPAHVSRVRSGDHQQSNAPAGHPRARVRPRRIPPSPAGTPGNGNREPSPARQRAKLSTSIGRIRPSAAPRPSRPIRRTRRRRTRFTRPRRTRFRVDATRSKPAGMTG